MLAPMSDNEDTQKYECLPCGYVYDPKEGDPDGGIEPGVSFQDLPDDWICPVCGIEKDLFEPFN
jgi:rubredoxin